MSQAISPKTILITGCSSGIGLETATLLHHRGHRVFASARRETDIARLKSLGLRSLSIDVTNSHSIRDGIDTLLAETNGHLDVLFNNAGYAIPGAVEDIGREALRDQFETNLFGPAELMHRIIPVMRRQGHGRIIQNSSVLGFVALPFRGAYNASKFALEGLTDTLRLELRGTDIHVVLIEPGPILTRFRENAHRNFMRHVNTEKSAFRKQYESMLQRLQEPGAAVPFTLPASAVAEKVMHAVESSRPQARYYVTFPTYLFAILKRLLPTSALDRIVLAVGRS